MDEIVGKRGPRALAARVIPAAAKLNLAIPDHMEVVRGTMDGMEEGLRAPGS